MLIGYCDVIVFHSHSSRKNKGEANNHRTNPYRDDEKHSHITGIDIWNGSNHNKLMKISNSQNKSDLYEQYEQKMEHQLVCPFPSVDNDDLKWWIEKLARPAWMRGGARWDWVRLPCAPVLGLSHRHCVFAFPALPPPPLPVYALRPAD